MVDNSSRISHILLVRYKSTRSGNPENPECEGLEALLVLCGSVQICADVRMAARSPANQWCIHRLRQFQVFKV